MVSLMTWANVRRSGGVWDKPELGEGIVVARVFPVASAVFDDVGNIFGPLSVSEETSIATTIVIRDLSKACVGHIFVVHVLPFVSVDFNGNGVMTRVGQGAGMIDDAIEFVDGAVGCL